MTAGAPENEHFVRLVHALNPWLNQVVIIGGWAHRLYRLHPLAQRMEYPPLTTLDTDIAVPERITTLAARPARAKLSSAFLDEPDFLS